MATRIVALLSDFGLDDWFVGVMKGVVLSVNPGATVIDVAHSIPRQDVAAGSFALLASYAHLPPGAVVVAVVDPGVGTGRRIICAEAARRLFLAPDNGLLTRVLLKEGCARAVAVKNDEYFLKPVSSTFHGRDIFASVAGHLSLGLDIGRLGPDISDPVEIEVAVPVTTGNSAVLTVQWVDSFGNLITNCGEELTARLGAGWRNISIAGAGGRPLNLVENYESVGVGQIMGIVGSSGYLEISVREGSAADLLGLTIGSELRLTKA